MKRLTAMHKCVSPSNDTGMLVLAERYLSLPSIVSPKYVDMDSIMEWESGCLLSRWMIYEPSGWRHAVPSDRCSALVVMNTGAGSVSPCVKKRTYSLSPSKDRAFASFDEIVI